MDRGREAVYVIRNLPYNLEKEKFSTLIATAFSEETVKIIEYIQGKKNTKETIATRCYVRIINKIGNKSSDSFLDFIDGKSFVNNKGIEEQCSIENVPYFISTIDGKNNDIKINHQMGTLESSKTYQSFLKQLETPTDSVQNFDTKGIAIQESWPIVDMILRRDGKKEKKEKSKDSNSGNRGDKRKKGDKKRKRQKRKDRQKQKLLQQQENNNNNNSAPAITTILSPSSSSLGNNSNGNNSTTTTSKTTGTPNKLKSSRGERQRTPKEGKDGAKKERKPRERKPKSEKSSTVSPQITASSSSSSPLSSSSSSTTTTNTTTTTTATPKQKSTPVKEKQFREKKSVERKPKLVFEPKVKPKLPTSPTSPTSPPS